MMLRDQEGFYRSDRRLARACYFEAQMLPQASRGAL